jgi:hypothetical protein
MNYKKEILGTLTDNAPGPEVGKLRFSLVQAKVVWMRRNRLFVWVEAAFDSIQDCWGDNFGPDESPDNHRNVNQWLERLSELEEKKQAWREDPTLVDRDPNTLSESVKAEMWVAGGVTGFCKMALDAVQQDWGVSFGQEWQRPRSSLKEWVDDLLKFNAVGNNAFREKMQLASKLDSMGWDCNEDRWRDEHDPIWSRIYKERFTAWPPATVVPPDVATASPPAVATATRQSTTDLDTEDEFIEDDEAVAVAIRNSLRDSANFRRLRRRY